jgi:hypothetical protein
MIQVVTGPHRALRPRAVGEKVEEPIVCALRALRLAAGARGDRLDALALAVAQDTERIRGERLPLLASWKVRTDLLEVRAESTHARAVHLVGHACTMHASRDDGNHARRPHRRMERHSERQTTSSYRGEISHFPQ